MLLGNFEAAKLGPTVSSLPEKELTFVASNVLLGNQQESSSSPQDYVQESPPIACFLPPLPF